jgi:hydrogenase-4 component F
MIFRALFEGHHLFVLIFVLVLLTMILWAFGKNIFRLLFTPPVHFDATKAEKVSGYESVSQFVLLGLVIYLGFNPPAFMVELIQDAVKNVVH